MDKCCVCGKETEDLDTRTSILTKQPRAYCPSCLVTNLEPYEDLVNFCWEYSMYSRTFQQKTILPTLQLNNKTVQQFNEEVRKKQDEKDT